MKKQFSIFLLFSAISTLATAQLGNITASKAGNFYLLAGYNRGWFSKSDIHIKGFYSDSPSVPEAARGQKYSFTLLGAKALDNPDIKSLSKWDINSPQFYFRLGYFFYGEYINGVELGLDHFIYALKPSQRVRVQGLVYDSTAQIVGNVERDMLVTEDFVQLQHDNGVNYLMVSFVRGMHLYRNRTETHMIVCLVKPGLGVAITRSNLAVNRDRKQDEFHIGGYVGGLEVAFRYTMMEQFFIETAGKGCYANISDVLSVPGISASHTFTSFEWLVSIGYQFRL